MEMFQIIFLTVAVSAQVTSTDVTNETQIQIPKPQIVLKPSYQVLYSTENVTLECVVHGEIKDLQYEWYKDLTLLKPPLDQAIILVNTSGRYECKAKKGAKESEKSDLKILNLQAIPTPKLTLEPALLSFYPSEKVTLKCEINGSSDDWSYTLYKDKTPLQECKSPLEITLALKDDSVEYTCQRFIKDRVNTEMSSAVTLKVNAIPTPKLTLEPALLSFYPSEKVTLKCEIEGSSDDWSYKWYKNNAPPQESKSPLEITLASKDDSVEYTCQGFIKDRVNTEMSSAVTLKVNEPPQPNLSIETQWKTFYSTEKITLKCSVNEKPDDWDYEWKRNETVLSKEEGISLTGNTLSIKKAKTSDAGSYKCKAKHRKRSPVTTSETDALQLHISGATPKPEIKKHPSFKFFYTDERVRLDCNMPGVGWEYHWYKVPKTTEPSITNTNYTINSASLSDAGDYYCKAKRGDFSIDSETLKVDVQARSPAVLTLGTELSDIMAGNILTLRCDVSDGQEWNYTWYENGQELNESSNTLKVTATEDTIKNEFKCRGERTVRPLYSSWSEGFVANNIVFKRKILLAISGFFVCCIVILIVGCIVLKVTRKPEKKETEHGDLFISMADSKNQATTPLMEYMDNKPIEKDSGEKEELQLDHISVTHVDGVIEGEDSPSAEANGLTSFKGT